MAEVRMSALKDALQSAKFEIEQLRRRNEILGAKVEMIELFSTVLHTEPRRQGGLIGPDVIWQLQKELDKLNRADDITEHEPSAQELGAAIRASGQVGKGMSGR